MMFTMKDIIREGHPSLTTKATPVLFPISKNDIDLGQKLMTFVKNSQDEVLAKKYKLRPGVGLAAPQVNVLKRMFAMHAEDMDGTLYSYIVINPQIARKSSEQTYLPGGEGCLSIDRDTNGITPRHFEIHATGYQLDQQTSQLKPLNITLKGYPAIVFQHEYDHLDGILFTSKLYQDIPHAFPLLETESESND